MKSFNHFWKSHDVHVQEELDEVKDEVHEMDEALDEIEEISQPKEKTRTEKPGESIHSAKWDDCVAEVKASGTGKNAYAVCTAQLGDEAFKSQYHGLVSKHQVEKAQKELKKFGIEEAGPVPNSLLARQDLEDETEKSFNQVWKDSSRGITTEYYKGYKIDIYVELTGEMYVIAMSMEFSSVVAAKKAIDTFLLKKSAINNDEKIEEIGDKGKDEDEGDQEVLADKIESLQGKRQKATISERQKSFNQMWKEKNER